MACPKKSMNLKSFADLLKYFEINLNSNIFFRIIINETSPYWGPSGTFMGELFLV